MGKDEHWVGTWGTAPAPSVAGIPLDNHTIRMMRRLSTGGDTVHETHRVAFNEWICVSDEVGGLVDFDLALRDPDIPTQMLPIYDCGDGFHPSDLGYCEMGNVIDLALFD